MFLKTVNEKCEADWRKSNYSMVISSIRTSIFTIQNTVASLLLCNDSLCSMAVALGGVSHLTKTDDRIILEEQGNIVYLAAGGSSENPPLIKQRTENGHALRKQSKILVTGSTINTALGKDGLKKQKSFWEERDGKTEAEQIPDFLKERFEYGTRNELNAVATLISRYLPAFHPTTCFYEEGCYTCSHESKINLIVSPMEVFVAVTNILFSESKSNVQCLENCTPPLFTTIFHTLCPSNSWRNACTGSKRTTVSLLF